MSLLYCKYLPILAVMLVSFFFVEKIGTNGMPPRRNTILLFILLFINAMLIYYSCMGKGITGDDSAEYALKVMNFEIAHGGGYPFYLALGKIFALPFGNDYSFALNLMSAFFSALSVVIVSIIISLLTQNNKIAFYISLQFALIPAFWSQAVMAEVINVNTCAGLLIILFLVVHKHVNKPHIPFGFACGLATGIYFPILLIYPAVFTYLFIKGEGSFNKRMLNASASIISMLAGVSIVIIVTLLISAKEYPLGTLIPPVDTISLLGNWMGSNATPSTGIKNPILTQLWIFVLHHATSYLVISFIISLYGMALLFSRDKKLAVFFSFIIAVNGLFVYLTQVTFYHLMTNISYGSIAVCAAFGYDSLIQKFKTCRGFLNAIIMALPVFSFITGVTGFNTMIPANSRVVDKSSMTYYEKFVDDMFIRLPDRAIIFTSWDKMTAIRYIQARDKKRTDIASYETRDGMWHDKRQIKDWRGFIIENYHNRPIFLTGPDPSLSATTRLVKITENLWRIH